MNGTCPCGARMTVPRREWRAMTAAARAEARAAGLQTHEGNGLCVNCYRRSVYVRRPRRKLVVRDSQGYTAAELLAEWSLVYDPELSKRQNCLRHAGRLGFKPATLERRLERLGWQPPSASMGYRTAA